MTTEQAYRDALEAFNTEDHIPGCICVHCETIRAALSPPPVDVQALKKEVFENMGDTDKPFFIKAGETIHLAPEQLVFKAIDYLAERNMIRGRE